MHRVFQAEFSTIDDATLLAPVRAEFRSLNLIEVPVGLAYEYHAINRAGGAALFATLHPQGASATIYLYPDALGGPPGIATAFYLRLDEAGFGLGSKLGPSISLDPGNADRCRMFFAGLREVAEAARAAG